MIVPAVNVIECRSAMWRRRLVHSIPGTDQCVVDWVRVKVRVVRSYNVPDVALPGDGDVEAHAGRMQTLWCCQEKVVRIWIVKAIVEWYVIRLSVAAPKGGGGV